ncbi:hypothetical protein ACLVWU_17875 [Bdellovibrio sp. HCB290]|uniref:hypothetical protein n=1 Tax=Bdellovibrio sp. HCB290 TaxID=3394356 RepID=UPI0039B5B13B
MKTAKLIRITAMSLLGLVMASPAMAAMTSGQIIVSLTIVDAAQMTSEGFSANPADYTGGRYITALTDARDGEKVGIYLNGKQVASAVSNKGVINFQLNAKNAENINVSLKSQGREVQVIQAAYRSRANSPAPHMALDPQIRQVQVGNQTVNVQSVIITY